jgi:hypothetical protein
MIKILKVKVTLKKAKENLVEKLAAAFAADVVLFAGAVPHRQNNKISIKSIT